MSDKDLNSAQVLEYLDAAIEREKETSEANDRSDVHASIAADCRAEGLKEARRFIKNCVRQGTGGESRV